MRAASWCAIAVAILCAAIGVGSNLRTPEDLPKRLPQRLDGLISGTVRGPEGSTSLTGRVVEVVNLETAERQRAVTNDAGSFSFHVRPGTYRVEVALTEGESIVHQPGAMRVTRRAVDEHADIIIRGARASRRPAPATHVDPGLGQPIA